MGIHLHQIRVALQKGVRLDKTAMQTVDSALVPSQLVSDAVIEVGLWVAQLCVVGRIRGGAENERGAAEDAVVFGRSLRCC